MHKALLILITLSIGCGSFSFDVPEEMPLENNFMPGRWLFTIDTDSKGAEKFEPCYLEIRKDEDKLSAKTEECPLAKGDSLKGMVEEGNKFYLLADDYGDQLSFRGVYGSDGSEAYGGVSYTRDSIFTYANWSYEFFAERED